MIAAKSVSVESTGLTSLLSSLELLNTVLPPSGIVVASFIRKSDFQLCFLNCNYIQINQY